MKHTGIFLIGAIFLVSFIMLYIKKKTSIVKPALPAPAGVPLKKYPNWRILPYDPYKIGGVPAYDPYTMPKYAPSFTQGTGSWKDTAPTNYDYYRQKQRHS